MKVERLGLYGGTFSPPHIGHYRAAEAFINEFQLDRLLIMPASIPPHKALAAGDNPVFRMNMAEICFEPLCSKEHAVVSDLELRRQGRSYTSDTLRELYEIYGLTENHGVYMLTGTDMFLTLDTWHEAETIFELAHIVYALRNDSDLDACVKKKAEYERRYGAAIDRLILQPFDISSTEIRRMIAENMETEEVLDPRVLEYIIKEGLYRESNA